MGESTKTYSDKHEKAVAKYLGWKQVSGSGSRPCAVGDVRGASWLCECKTHTTPGHKLTFVMSVWDKIMDEAMSQHLRPVLMVDDGSQKIQNTWCLFNSLPEFWAKHGVVGKDDYYITELPERFMNVNVNFTLDDMREEKKHPFTVFRFRVNGKIHFLCNIETFREMLLDGSLPYEG